MRNAALLGAILILAAGNLFGGTCNDPYLLISGIQGELPAPCQGAIEFMNVNVSPSTFTMTKTLDKASPQLMLACANGKHLTEATLRASASETITFKDVTVTQWSQSVNNNTPTESVSFNFTKIEVKSTTGKTSFSGGARPTTATAFLASSGGGAPEQITHFETMVRAGGAATTSIQLAAKPTALKAGVFRGANTATTPPPPATMEGFIELRSPAGAVLSRYQFTGGVRGATGNLRVERLIVPH